MKLQLVVSFSLIALFPTAASADSCSKYNSNYYCNDGKVYSRYNNSLYDGRESSWSVYDSSVYGPDHESISEYGNTLYDSKGQAWSVYGNTIYQPDGSICSWYANTLYCQAPANNKGHPDIQASRPAILLQTDPDKTGDN